MLRAAGLIYEVGVVRPSGLNQYEHDWRAHRHILPSMLPTRTTCVRSVKLCGSPATAVTPCCVQLAGHDCLGQAWLRQSRHASTEAGLELTLHLSHTMGSHQCAAASRCYDHCQKRKARSSSSTSTCARSPSAQLDQTPSASSKHHTEFTDHGYCAWKQGFRPESEFWGAYNELSNCCPSLPAAQL